MLKNSSKKTEVSEQKAQGKVRSYTGYTVVILDYFQV